MRWAYKTVLYPLQKDGFLGDSFLDEVEMERSLNEYGRGGWELVALLEVAEGFRAVFKHLLAEDEDTEFTPSMLETPVSRQKKEPSFETFKNEDVPVENVCKRDSASENEDAGAIRIE